MATILPTQKIINTAGQIRKSNFSTSKFLKKIGEIPAKPSQTNQLKINFTTSIPLLQ